MQLYLSYYRGEVISFHKNVFVMQKPTIVAIIMATKEVIYKKRQAGRQGIGLPYIIHVKGIFFNQIIKEKDFYNDRGRRTRVFLEIGPYRTGVTINILILLSID